MVLVLNHLAKDTANLEMRPGNAAALPGRKEISTYGQAKCKKKHPHSSPPLLHRYTECGMCGNLLLWGNVDEFVGTRAHLIAG
jgi:hypothetical protein